MAGVIGAWFQKLEGPIFVVAALGYSAILIVALRGLLSFFPLYVELSMDSFIQLNLHE